MTLWRKDHSLRNRIILPTLAGSLAAAIVWAWPTRPLWYSPPDMGRLEGFSPDGKILVTSRVPSTMGGRFPNPEVCRWDAGTGKLLGCVEMACVDPSSVKEVRPSADGQIALVGEGVPPDVTRADFASGQWYLHDAVTGQRRAGPVPDLAAVPQRPFSPGSRWFAGLRGAPGGGFQGLRDFAIFSAATGDLILGLPNQDGRIAVCYFASDGETAAVHWVPENEKARASGAGHRVQVLELPSGRERYRFDLPQRSWERIDRWDGRYLEASASVPGPESGKSRRVSYTFDLSQNPVGDGIEDPLLCEPERTFWIAGSDWVAYFSFLPPDAKRMRVGSARDWVAAQVGLAHAPPEGRPWVIARFVDRATGATKYEMPYPLPHPCVVSQDGRRLACASDYGGVEVWNADPPPRWPKALFAGTVVAAGLLGLQRGWRRYRQQKS